MRIRSRGQALRRLMLTESPCLKLPNLIDEEQNALNLKGGWEMSGRSHHKDAEAGSNKVHARLQTCCECCWKHWTSYCPSDSGMGGQAQVISAQQFFAV